MMNLALCTCGEDITDHPDAEYPDDPPGRVEHPFVASGTKYRCEERIPLDGGYVLCPRPAYHKDHGVECGIVNGDYLWVDSE